MAIKESKNKVLKGQCAKCEQLSCVSDVQIPVDVFLDNTFVMR